MIPSLILTDCYIFCKCHPNSRRLDNCDFVLVCCLPLSLANSIVHYDNTLAHSGGYPYGTVANITCDSGYVLIGPNSTTCQCIRNQSKIFYWNPSPPMCKLGNDTDEHLSALLLTRIYLIFPVTIFFLSSVT